MTSRASCRGYPSSVIIIIIIIELAVVVGTGALSIGTAVGYSWRRIGKFFLAVDSVTG